MKNKVLIISHTFPPSPGVGGRRWAKFAKYLTKLKWELSILTFKSKKKNEDSLWMKDVVSLNDINFYNGWYPQILTKTKLLGVIDKLTYSIWRYVLPFFCMGNYYDRATFLKHNFTKQLDKVIIAKNIEKIIVSGAPFNLLYYTAKYIEKHNCLTFIADFRDPWTWGQNYGIASISKRRKQIEKLKEAFVIDKASKVIVPTESMYDYLVTNYPQKKDKFELIPHGYDPEGLVIKENHNITENIKIAFIGELYNDVAHYFEALSKGILNAPISLSFFSPNDRYSTIFKNYDLLGNKVTYNKMIPPTDLFNLLKDFDYVLLIHPDYAKDYISTKFHELIYAKIPLLYIGKSGLTSDFILANNLGLYLGSQNDEIERKIANYKLIKDYAYFPTIDIKENSLEQITFKLNQILLNVPNETP